MEKTMTVLRKPEWLKIRRPQGKEISNYAQLETALKQSGLCTVCEEAKCPNINECWGNATATFMILGSICTRSCRFCSVQSAAKGNALDEDEPRKVAEAIKKMGIRYAVITSVDRDDLSDYGSGHFKKCVEEIRKINPKIKIELLIPDFNNKKECLDEIIGSKVNVIGHNIETVKDFQGRVRDKKANYEKSLSVLKYLKENSDGIFTKSSLMLGFGETELQILEAMDDLRNIGVDILTIGQYLQPTKRNIGVKEYIAPEKFDYYAKKAKEKGFIYVASGPFVRSSYLAERFFSENINLV